MGPKKAAAADDGSSPPLPVYSEPHDAQVELLAEALLREYMAKRGYRATLQAFDRERPRDARTVSQRSVMGDLMRLPPEAQARFKARGVDTIVEMLCCGRVDKRLAAAERAARMEELRAALREEIPSIPQEYLAAVTAAAAANDADETQPDADAAAAAAAKAARKARRSAERAAEGGSASGDGDRKAKEKKKSKKKKKAAAAAEGKGHRLLTIDELLEQDDTAKTAEMQRQRQQQQQQQQHLPSSTSPAAPHRNAAAAAATPNGSAPTGDAGSDNSSGDSSSGSSSANSDGDGKHAREKADGKKTKKKKHEKNEKGKEEEEAEVEEDFAAALQRIAQEQRSALAEHHSKRQQQHAAAWADDETSRGASTAASSAASAAAAAVVVAATVAAAAPLRAVGTAAVAAAAAGRQLGAAVAGELKTCLVGGDRRLPTSFTIQGFAFDAAVGHGLVQREGGCCGVLAAVQAFAIGGLFGGGRLLTDDVRRAALAEALAAILLQIEPSPRRVVVVTDPTPHALPVPAAKGISGIGGGGGGATAHNGFLASDAATMAGQVRAMAAFERTSGFESRQALEEALLAVVASRWSQPEGSGLLCAVLSALLSRGGAAAVESDMDLASPLVVEHGYCAQELANLFLCGRAVSGVHDGVVERGGMALRGFPTPTTGTATGTATTPKGLQVGFLSHMEHRQLVRVGDSAKRPQQPVWVVYHESHYTTLFMKKDVRASLLPIKATAATTKFDLHFWDQHGGQDEDIRLTIELDPAATATRREEGSLVPYLNEIVRTVPEWRSARVNWNGTDPLL